MTPALIIAGVFSAVALVEGVAWLVQEARAAMESEARHAAARRRASSGAP